MDVKLEHTQRNARKWDARAATYDSRRFNYFRWMQQRVIRMIDLKPGCRFLDVGCGTGWAVRYVARALRDRGQFYGVDISAKMIEMAQFQSSAFANVHFYRTSAEEIPLESDSVDFAICTNAFHHFLDPASVLNEIRHVLVRGGRLYILDLTADDFLTRWIDRRTVQREREHVKFYASADYQALFAGARLRHLASQFLLYPMKVHVAERV